MSVYGDVAVCLAVVVSTGYWDSPYIFSLATAIMVAGFAKGFAFAIRNAIGSTIAIALPLYLLDGDESLAQSAQWAAELLLMALVAGYGRRLFREAQQRTSLALTRLSRMTEANALLSELHRVAQVLPASLDLGETVLTTVTRVRELVESDVVAVLLHDDTTGSWSVAAAEGARLPKVFADGELPRPVAQSAQGDLSVLVRDLQGEGLSKMAATAIYTPLRARGRLVGVVAVERRTPGSLHERELRIMDGVGEQAALAIDNARWFGSLRRVGADEERTRIARELHDRVGQSLAYLAFELDRISGRAQENLVHDELEVLRGEVREVIGEVRETLYDLRTDVSEGQDLVSTLNTFLQRVRQRTDLEVEFVNESTDRLPLPVEREVWRIAQEAITNIERHAAATTARVRWWCDGERGLLEVSDDGKGLAATTAGRPDSYGVLGMRERAEAIAGTLEIVSPPGQGTTVRCRVSAQ